MKWIKADKDNFPKGKCLAIFLEPTFGHFSLEIRTAYYDDPSDYEDNEGQGWLDWHTDREIMVTHFMELPEIDFDLVENRQEEFINKFGLCEFGIVPNEAIKTKNVIEKV